MLLAHNISMSLATVIRVRECSLNQFCPLLFASLFVHWEPQQILMSLNTKYRANLVKARVNVPVTLLDIYWVCQYKLFFISEGWEGFTEPSKPSLEHHWSDNKYFQQQYRIYFFMSDIDFGFKYFLEIVCTKITL